MMMEEKIMALEKENKELRDEKDLTRLVFLKISMISIFFAIGCMYFGHLLTIANLATISSGDQYIFNNMMNNLVMIGVSFMSYIILFIIGDDIFIIFDHLENYFIGVFTKRGEEKKKQINEEKEND